MAQYFDLTLDTTAPSLGSISFAKTYYNTSATATISASGATYMKVWVTQSATGSTDDSNFPSNWEVYSTSKTVALSSQGSNYAHVIFMDEVGNISSISNSSAIVYDSVAPTISSAVINDDEAYTNNTSVTVRVTIPTGSSADVSGVSYVTLSGDITQTGSSAVFQLTDTDRSNGYIDCNVTLTTGDGTKSISVTATDRAGNTSTSTSDTIILNTETNVTAVLRKSDDSANLSTTGYTNLNTFALALETTDNLTAYKIWGDISGSSTEPADWTTATWVDGRLVISPLTFTSSEGTKTVYAKVKDVANNVAETSTSIIYDVTDPLVTLSVNPNVISAQTGYNTVTFTLSATDTSTLTNYRLKLDDTTIKSGTFTDDMTVSVTESEIVAISAGQGSKSFTLEVDDAAGNTGVSSEIIVSVDLTSPTGSIFTSAYYNTTTVSATITGSDTGGGILSYMKAWIDTDTPSSWSAYSSGTKSFTSVSEGQHTAHVQFMDSVGNVSSIYDSSTFIVDTTAPTGAISGNAYTNSSSYQVSLTYSDAKSGIITSGVSHMKIWEGDSEPTTWETVASSKTITLSSGDGTKTIHAKIKDNAGNEATLSSITTILDTGKVTPILTLYMSDNVTSLPAQVNYRNFVARVSYNTSETQTSPVTHYQLTGDFDQSSDSWQTFTADSSQSYMTIPNLTLTSTEGLKTISLLMKDAAGNISTTAAVVTVIYDITLPVIDITVNPDFNIISKQHTIRLTHSGSTVSSLTGKYNDTVIFSWSPSEALQSYKVCVNDIDQTAEGAIAIGTSGGSLNVSGGSVAADAVVTTTIRGADFAATSVVNDVDGAYEVIVYGKDLGGTWSAVHSLN